MHTQKLQNIFFARLKEKVPQHFSLPEIIAEILSVSIDSAYRRIRGESVLGYDEAIIISNYFKISLAELAEPAPGHAIFHYIPSEPNKEMFLSHLQSINNTLEELHEHSDAKLWYAAVDAPLFYHFGRPKLAAFKIHFWMKVTLGYKEFGTYYNAQDIPKQFTDICIATHENYLHIPSIEIWSEDILYTTLRQIQFYADASYFKDVNDALQIIDELHLAVEEVEKFAESGSKRHDTAIKNFEVYQSDVLLGSNTVLTRANNQYSAFLSHQTFKALSTTDTAYCAATEEWFKNILSKANLISGVAEKNRNKFFKKLYGHIADTRNNISGG